MTLTQRCAALSIVWCFLVGAYGWWHPPAIPLDLSPKDAATAAAYTAAVWKSHLFWGIIACAPLLGVVIIILITKLSQKLNLT